MRPIVITIRQRGLPARRIVGVFASTADAVIHTLEALGDTARGSVSAKALT
jgi:hypothetical protein